MRRRKTPQEKKDLSYRKDFILQVEYPNGFHRSWPIKKAQSHRKERHQVQQILAQVTPSHAAEQRPDIPLTPVRRDLVRKWISSVAPLGQVVARRKYMRVYRTAWNFFKKPYARSEHRTRFVAFLESLVAEQDDYVNEVTKFFDEILNPPSTANLRAFTFPLEPRKEWLQAFFEDEPAWEERLRAWVARSQTSVSR